jgi:hypothetical protein
VRFTEINLFGVYVAPVSVMMVAAWFGTVLVALERRPLRSVALRLAPLAVRIRRLHDCALVDGPRSCEPSPPCRMLMPNPSLKPR